MEDYPESVVRGYLKRFRLEVPMLAGGTFSPSERYIWHLFRQEDMEQQMKNGDVVKGAVRVKVRVKKV